MTRDVGGRCHTDMDGRRLAAPPVLLLPGEMIVNARSGGAGGHLRLGRRPGTTEPHQEASEEGRPGDAE